MKILLSGARGFTGKYFAEAALRAGHEVHALSADLTDAVAVAAEVAHANAECVVHLAAISFVGHADARAFYDVNLFGTLNLLQALSAHKPIPRKVLLISSANVYGNCAISPIRETQAPEPINHYGVSKLAMEFMAKPFAHRLPLVVARTFNYTGPGQAPTFVIPKLVEHFRDRRERISLGNLTVEREFNDVRAVCEIYLRLLEAGVPSETYNVCSGKPFTLQYVIEQLVEETGHTLRVETDASFVRRNEVRRLCGDPAKLVASIGVVDHPPIRETLRWMLASNSAPQ